MQATGNDVLPDISVGWVVFMEVLISSWTTVQMVSVMRENLIRHADEVTNAGYAYLFEFLQSIESPTFFITVEVYLSIYRLQKCIHEFDEMFASDMMKLREVANHVRQIHECAGCL